MYRQGGGILTSAGVTMPAYSRWTMALSVGNTTETFTFYQGSTIVATWVIVYTDSNRTTPVSGLFADTT